jgi:hypothetical protein
MSARSTTDTTATVFGILACLIAVVWGSNALSALGHSRSAASSAIERSATDPADCNPKDPLSECAVMPQFGYPAGDLFVHTYF